MSNTFCSHPAKNFFRVVFRSGGQLQSHSFQASDTFNKQQWLNCIRQAKEAVVSAESGPARESQVGRVKQCIPPRDCLDCNIMDTTEATLDQSTECPQT